MSVMEAITNILRTSVTYKKEELSLFEELEAGTEEGEERDFYRDFQKIPYSAEVINKVKKHFSKLDTNFTKVKEEKVEAVKEKRFPTIDKQVVLLAGIIEGLQEKVRDQGVAIELLKKVIVAQAAKLEEVEARVVNPGVEVTNYIDTAIKIKMETTMKEHTKEVDAMKEELAVVKQENTRLRQENTQMTLDNDETRQRGLKGNLIIHAPNAKQETKNGVTESVADMCRRLTQETSGAHIKPGDVAACHSLPDKPGTWLLAVGNRGPGSGWEDLAAGMLTGKFHGGGPRDYFKRGGASLSFQLTQARSSLLHQVRLARKAGHLSKFSVNQNGRITLRREKVQQWAPDQPRPRTKENWEVVRCMEDLEALFPDVTFPIPNPGGREGRGPREGRR